MEYLFNRFACTPCTRIERPVEERSGVCGPHRMARLDYWDVHLHMLMSKAFRYASLNQYNSHEPYLFGKVFPILPHSMVVYRIVGLVDCCMHVHRLHNGIGYFGRESPVPKCLFGIAVCATWGNIHACLQIRYPSRFV